MSQAKESLTKSPEISFRPSDSKSCVCIGMLPVSGIAENKQCVSLLDKESIMNDATDVQDLHNGVYHKQEKCLCKGIGEKINLTLWIVVVLPLLKIVFQMNIVMKGFIETYKLILHHW